MAQLVGPLPLNVGSTEQRDTTQKEQIGRRAQTVDGSVYVYGLAGAAITAKASCKVGATTVGFSGLLMTTNTDEATVCIAGAAFANAEYGWFYEEGGPGVSVIAAAGLTVGKVGVPTATDGELDAEGTSTLGSRKYVCVTTASGGFATVVGVS